MTETVPDTVSAQANAGANVGGDELSHPETWLWDDHGDVCTGRFVRFDKAATRDYGKKLILVLDVDGQERSVWLLQTALFNQIRDEVAERPNRNLSVGERVTIHRLPKTKTEDGNRSYHPFRSYFPDRPALDVASEFELDNPAKPETAPDSQADGADDDIPF
jgi:hypothetical protein